MELTRREGLVALISNAITAYSMYQERGELPTDTTIFGFVLDALPKDLRKEVSADMIDAVFNHVSSVHGSGAGRMS